MGGAGKADQRGKHIREAFAPFEGLVRVGPEGPLCQCDEPKLARYHLSEGSRGEFYCADCLPAPWR